MPVPSETAPWWAWLTWLGAIAIVPLITGAVSITVTLISRRDTKAELAATNAHVAEAKQATDLTLGEVKNTHTTNLREDLDEKFAALGDRLSQVITAQGGLRDDLGGVHSEVRDVRSQQDDMRGDILGIRSDGRKDRRRIAAQERQLSRHVEELPETIQQALTDHVSDCPARKP